MSRSTRIIEVTATLAVIGAIVGAVCGAGILAAVIVIRDGFSDLTAEAGVLVAGALFGATVGIFVAPALAWGILRRVALGKAILATALGTIIGAVVGELLCPLSVFTRAIPGVILGGFAGFIGGGLVARFRARRRRLAAPDAPITRLIEAREQPVSK